MSLAVALVATGMLQGCIARSAEDGRMPSALAFTVAFTDGDYGALIAEFSSPSKPPDLRYADGLWAFDGERLLQLHTAPRTEGDVRVYDLAVTEHLTGGRNVLVLGKSHDELRVRGLEHTAVALGSGKTPTWLGLSDGRPTEISHELDFHRDGPGQGFNLVEADGSLSLGLPHRKTELPLFRDVEEVICATWLTEVHDSAWEATGHYYKAVRLIPARGEPARVDGDLEEWGGAEALAVDSAGNVLSGEHGWSGPRDGSFGVAARLHHGRLTVAVRIRDDELLMGQDRLEFDVGPDVHVLPLQGAGPVDAGNWSGLEAVFTNAVDFGTGVEASFELKGGPPRRDALPLVVRYLDADTEEMPTVLASAPSLRSLALNVRAPETSGEL